MPEFLVPFPPTLSPTSESQAFSGSSLSLSSNSSFNYFASRLSQTSSGSAYLTDVTPPITPSHTVKGGYEDRERREHLSVDQAEDTGYDSDCEREDAPLLNAIDALCARLKKAKPSANAQRALKYIEEHPEPPSESDALLDEPLSATPSMPAMKVVVSEAEGGIDGHLSGDFENKTKIEAESAIPLIEDVGPTPTSNKEFTFLLNKEQVWQRFGDSEFEKEFHEGVREEMGQSFFPDEIKLHPANTFAFGTGSISGWREEPASILDEPIDEPQAAFELPVEKAVSDISDEQEAVLSPSVSLSPAMPGKPILHPMDDPDWSCSPLSLGSPSLGSPSLVYDTSVSFSQMILSPPPLDVAPMASSPGVYDNSFNNSNPLISPIIPISTLMYGSRRPPSQPDDFLARGQDMDLPTLMRLEIAAAAAAAAAAAPPRQQQQLEAGLAPDARPSGGHGLGFDIPPSQHLEPSFPSYSTLPSIYSLPSWTSEAGPTTSTPPPQSHGLFAESEAGVDGVQAEKDTDTIVEVPRTPARQALSDITEESTSSRALALANEAESFKEPPVVGLGLGALLESTLQSSSSITTMRSPELPPITGTVISEDLPATVSMKDVVDGRYQLPSAPIFKTTGLSGNENMAVGNSDIEPLGVLSEVPRHYSPGVENWRRLCAEVEPLSVPFSGGLSEVPQEVRHYSPGVENWRRSCAEVEPLNVPLGVETPSSSSPLAIGDFNLSQYFGSGIDLSSGLSEGSSINSALHHQALVCIQGFPLPLRYPPAHNDVAVINQDYFSLRVESDPRSPVASGYHIRCFSSDFTPYPAFSRTTSVNVEKPQSPDFIIEEVLRNPPPTPASVQDLVKSAPPSGRSSLKSSKSIEGIGMGLPSNLSGRPPRPHDVSSHDCDTTPRMMSTAEEYQDLAKLSTASPSSDSGSPNFTVSEERGGSRFFFKIPKFAKRNLYAIAEVLSPTSSAGGSQQSTSSGGRLLSSAWSDITQRLRSPYKSNLSKSSTSSHQSTSPLAGSSGDARSSATAITQLPANNSEVPSTAPLKMDISQLPQPPVLEPRQPRFSMLGRLSGFSRSPPPPRQEDAMSPGVVEHLDVPRGLGIFKRKPSPTTPSNKVKKESRFKPALRRFQLLF